MGGKHRMSFRDDSASPTSRRSARGREGELVLRSAILLHALCILLGAAGAIWCAPWIAGLMGASVTLAVNASLVTGIIGGAITAAAVARPYKYADTSWPYLLCSFGAIPVATLLTAMFLFAVKMMA